ncbi:MAG: protein kinase domain-containing protein [Acidimicrobiales bacterium]
MAEEPSVELGIPGLGPATRIGSGGFADVYRATQTNLRREVAVKVLRAAANDAQGKMRFERECHAVGAVSGHPNIVGVHEGGFTPDGRAYLVMEYCPSGTLLDRIERDGPMPAAEVIEIGQKIGRALAVAHDAGVLHRDVKPANILVTAYGEPALADFGIARVEGGQQTATGLVTASLAHAAPEVLGGEGPTASSDIYSLGSTLFQLVAGQAPHVRDDDQSVWALMNRVINEPVPDPVSIGITEPLATTIRVATAPTPTERYSTAGELVAALSAGPGSGGGSGAGEPAPAGAPPTVRGGPPVAQVPTATFGSSHDEPTATMAPVGADQAAGFAAVGAAPSGTGAPPTQPNAQVASPPGGVYANANNDVPAWAPPAGPVGGDGSDARAPRRRWWPLALGAVLALAVGGVVAAAVLLADGDQPPAELAFAFDLGSDGPLDAGDSFDLDIQGASAGTRYRYVVDGAPVGTPTEDLAPFVADPGRYSMAIEVTQGDVVTTTPPVDLYVIGDLPAAGYRANLSSITAESENWATALDVYDRLVDQGHTDLQILPSDRFASLRGGFWNLFVTGFGDDRDASLAYCESFGLSLPDECFVSFFDPEA